jgi:5-hydroxyisourate hydrolase-like protein (transthyretin family)
MRFTQRALIVVALASPFAPAAAALQGCSSDSIAAFPDASGVAVEDASPPADPDAAGAVDAGPEGDGGGAPRSVAFAYTPGWPGVRSVAVIGGFGLPTDWSASTPLTTLVDDGSGTFTGTAMLAPGQYVYVFRVQGDASAAAPAAFERYALDPAAAAFVACPGASPTYSTEVANPCSQLTVPTAKTTAALFHARGAVTMDGKPASGVLVELEREELQSHHFFVNRVTTGKDGTFDVAAAAGRYRLQILHPTYLTESDAARSPAALAALRRAISASFALGADTTLDTPDVAFHAYATFSPAGAAGPLPTSFTFAPAAGTRLAIYGTGMDGGAAEIGDPWYTSAIVSDGGVAFDGAFDTKKATDVRVVPGKRYFWGTERETTVDGGLAWTGQSMVLPITWP